jgi:hypothetical protein
MLSTVLPHWRHKPGFWDGSSPRPVVGADRIDELTPGRGDVWPAVTLRLTLTGGRWANVDSRFLAHGVPRAGDYYVELEDGTRTWIPGEVFKRCFEVVIHEVDASRGLPDAIGPWWVRRGQDG